MPSDMPCALCSSVPAEQEKLGCNSSAVELAIHKTTLKVCLCGLRLSKRFTIGQEHLELHSLMLHQYIFTSDCDVQDLMCPHLMIQKQKTFSLFVSPLILNPSLTIYLSWSLLPKQFTCQVNSFS